MQNFQHVNLVFSNIVVWLQQSCYFIKQPCYSTF